MVADGYIPFMVIEDWRNTIKKEKVEVCTFGVLYPLLISTMLPPRNNTLGAADGRSSTQNTQSSTSVVRDTISAPDELVTCVECTRPIDRDTDFCHMACGHRFHLQCYMTLYLLHNVTRCFLCHSTADVATLRQASGLGVHPSTVATHLPLDLGSDANVRRMLQSAVVSPTSLMTRSTHTEHQEQLPPRPTSMLDSSSTLSVSALVSGVLGVARPNPRDTTTTHTCTTDVHAALRRRLSAPELKRTGITIDHVVGSKITWRTWQELGYDVSDAVYLGARWRNLLDMKFGDAILQNNPMDYHLLRCESLNVSFALVMQDLFQNNYKNLARLCLSAAVLASLGMNWDDMLRLKLVQHDELVYFSYIPLSEICRWLHMGVEVFKRERFSLEFLSQMKWTKEQIQMHLHMNMTELSAIYQMGLVAIPTSGGGRTTRG